MDTSRLWVDVLIGRDAELVRYHRAGEERWLVRLLVAHRWRGMEMKKWEWISVVAWADPARQRTYDLKLRKGDRALLVGTLRSRVRQRRRDNAWIRDVYVELIEPAMIITRKANVSASPHEVEALLR